MLTICRTSRDVPGKVADKKVRMEEGSLGAVLENADPVGALAEGGLAGTLGEQSVLSAGVDLAALLLGLCCCLLRRGAGCVFCQGGGEGNRDQGKEKQLHGWQFGFS